MKHWYYISGILFLGVSVFNDDKVLAFFGLYFMLSARQIEMLEKIEELKNEK